MTIIDSFLLIYFYYCQTIINLALSLDLRKKGKGDPKVEVLFP